MGVIVRSSTVIRGLVAVLALIAWVILALIGGPDQKSYVVAAILTAVIVYSNWCELTEQAAHMAHHMPAKGVQNEGNHEPHTHQGR